MGVARRESNNQEQTEDKMISRTEVFLLATAILGVRGSGHDNFCRDLTDYGGLTTVDEEVNVCSYEMKKDCPETTESHCMEVTELECDVELFTDCTIDWRPACPRRCPAPARTRSTGSGVCSVRESSLLPDPLQPPPAPSNPPATPASIRPPKRPILLMLLTSKA